MSKNKIIIFIMLVIAIVITLIYFEKPLLRMFKQKESLNYQNIDCIEVIRLTKGIVKIDKKEDIEKILDYLNSLELIKEELPNYKIENRIDMNNYGYFFIDFFGSTSDRIVFTTNYLSVVYNGYDWERTPYYIVNSGYNPKDQTSNFSDFLDEILIKYME